MSSQATKRSKWIGLTGTFICRNCGEEKDRSDSYGWNTCKVCVRKRADKWGELHPEKVKAAASKYYKKWFPLHRTEINSKARAHKEALRIEVLVYYGSKCACCGYSDLSKKIHGRGFLQIDHIAGGGKEHFRQIKAMGSAFYKWLKDNNYPAGFRVLCGGCNNSIEPNAEKCELHK